MPGKLLFRQRLFPCAHPGSGNRWLLALGIFRFLRFAGTPETQKRRQPETPFSSRLHGRKERWWPCFWQIFQCWRRAGFYRLAVWIVRGEPHLLLRWVTVLAVWIAPEETWRWRRICGLARQRVGGRIKHRGLRAGLFRVEVQCWR